MEYNLINDLSLSSTNESNDKSDSESIESTPEEERIRRLFFTCDTDGDGFITYDDIRQVCVQLQMDYCVEEIMEELGTDANGRISYSEFVMRRSELLQMKPSDASQDCGSTASESKEPLIDLDLVLDQSSQGSSFDMSSVTDELAFRYHQSHSSVARFGSKGIYVQNEIKVVDSGNTDPDNQLALKRDDSWEFDSGTHDLEVDTMSLHRQIEASGLEVPHNINELLDLATKVSIGCIAILSCHHINVGLTQHFSSITSILLIRLNERRVASKHNWKPSSMKSNYLIDEYSLLR